MVEVRKNQRRDRKITVGEPRFAQEMATFQEVRVNGATGGTTVDALSDRIAERAGSDPVGRRTYQLMKSFWPKPAACCFRNGFVQKGIV